MTINLSHVVSTSVVVRKITLNKLYWVLWWWYVSCLDKTDTELKFSIMTDSVLCLLAKTHLIHCLIIYTCFKC